MPWSLKFHEPIKLARYQRIAKAKQEATAARAARPVIASTLHLSATAAADDLNRRVSASGKRWQATQVIRKRLGLVEAAPAV